MRPFRPLLAVLVASCVIAGCSSDSDSDDVAGPGATQAPLAAEQGADEPVGGILRLAMARPAHLDPSQAGPVTPAELVVADLLYDGLTVYDQETKTAVPALASRWEADEEATVWRFTLDPGASFNDGSPVRAADVKASLERIAGGGPDAPAARLLAPIAGSDEVLSGDTPELSGVVVEGEDVVVVTLAEPLGALPELLSSPLLGIAPAGASGAALDELPAGSGPFRLVAGEAGGSGRLLDAEVIRLERVPGGAALVDGIDLVLVDDGPAAVDLVTDGGADAAFVPRDVGDLPGGVEEVIAPFGAELFYGLNLRNPKLGDPRLREAIIAAVDRDAIGEGVYGGALAPLRGVVPAGVPGAAAAGCGEACVHDPERARGLIEEAFPGGDAPELFIDVDAGGRQEQVATAIAADLRAVGIPATVRAHADEAYAELLGGGGHEVFRLGWSGGWPSAGAYLEPLFRSGAPENVVGLSLAPIDAALDRARQMIDPAERAAAYAAVEVEILAELPVLPIGQFRTRLATSERVRGLELSVDGTFHATRVHLDRPG